MYFLDDEALSEDLANSCVPARDVAIYTALIVGLQVPIWYVAPVETVAEMVDGALNSLPSLFSVAVVIVGLRRCYLQNGGSEGEAFAERFVALGWVVGLQVGIVLIPLFFLLSFLIDELITQYLPVVVLAIQIAYYWRLSALFGNVRKAVARRITSP